MALGAEVRADAKRYDAEYEEFYGYDRETGEMRLYGSYGVAYRYVNDRARRGGNVAIFGVKRVGDRYEEHELCGC